MPLHIRPLQMNDLTTIIDMALETYALERSACDALPAAPNTEYIRGQLCSIIETGTGRMAIEAEIPVGFLAFEKPYPMQDGVYGATSPLFGYGVRHDKRDVVMSKLFQNIAAELCENYTQNLRVNVYAHDTQILWMYIMTAFAMDVTEVAKNIVTPIISEATGRFTYREVSKSELPNYKTDIVDLYRHLINHLRVSPVFYHCKYFLPLEDRFDDFLAENLRLFASFEGDRLVGMIDCEPVDILLLKSDTEALCMGDVFVKPEYRGEGVAAQLLAFANEEVKKDGVKRLYVTHGTINPNARGFWDKYFTNYAYSLTRGIDAEMLGKIERV